MEWSELDPEYAALVTALRERGLEVTINVDVHGPPQLVLRDTGGGPSFWTSRADDGVWWVVTWGGHFYTAPGTHDLAELCAAIAATRGRLYDLPGELVVRFDLTRRDDLPIFGGRPLEGWDAEEDGVGGG